jgi:hypothetical protein
MQRYLREAASNTARLTAVDTLRNPVAEELRNLVGRFALGFTPVQHTVVEHGVDGRRARFCITPASPV